MTISNIWKEPSKENRNKEKAAKVSMLVYPDSVNDGWNDYLKNTGLKVAISPLHDNDINDDGSINKPHYHIVIVYSHSVNWYQFAEIRDKINAYKNFEKVKSTQNIINYLTHDSYTSAAKFKYSKDNIQWINCCELDFMEDEYLRVINFIEDNQIFTLRFLIQSLLKNGYEGQLLVKWITQNVIFTNSYLRSFIQKNQK